MQIGMNYGSGDIEVYHKAIGIAAGNEYDLGIQDDFIWEWTPDK